MTLVKKSQNFYDLLGIDKSVSIDEVRKAYRKRALETHPDKQDPSATEQEKQATEREFQKVHEAFETLGDPLKKRRYDAVLATRLDPNLVSKESARLMADRREWASQREALTRRRMESYRAQLKNKPSGHRSVPTTPTRPQMQVERRPPTTKHERDLQKVTEILSELMNSHPELAARRRVILQRKAEREQAEKNKAQAQQPQEPPLTA